VGTSGGCVAEDRQLRGLTQEVIRVDRTYLARIEAGRGVILPGRIVRLLRRPAPLLEDIRLPATELEVWLGEQRVATFLGG